MMVSFRVSPLVELVTFGSVNPMTRAPRRFAAVSKLNRVLVDGSKNKVATTLPLQQLPVGMFLKLSGHSKQIHDLLFGMVCNSHQTPVFHFGFLFA